jgi:hypothetical protein
LTCQANVAKDDNNCVGSPPPTNCSNIGETCKSGHCEPCTPHWYCFDNSITDYNNCYGSTSTSCSINPSTCIQCPDVPNADGTLGDAICGQCPY